MKSRLIEYCDFPLRNFVRCGHCQKPLTASGIISSTVKWTGPLPHNLDFPVTWNG